MKVPIKNMPRRTALFFPGRRTLKRSGMGMLIIMRSEEMLRTALVIRWFVAAEHWEECGGTAQYCWIGRHQTPR